MHVCIPDEIFEFCVPILFYNKLLIFLCDFLLRHNFFFTMACVKTELILFKIVSSCKYISIKSSTIEPF